LWGFAARSQSLIDALKQVVQLIAILEIFTHPSAELQPERAGGFARVVLLIAVCAFTTFFVHGFSPVEI